MCSLQQQIEAAKSKIVTDGYGLSISSLIDMYQSGEGICFRPRRHHIYQWTVAKKSLYIESLFLGIPVPPIVVQQDHDSGVWTVLEDQMMGFDYQQLATLLQFVGILKDEKGDVVEPFQLEGTTLPGLAGKGWGDLNDSEQGLLRRVNIDVVILLLRSGGQLPLRFQ